MKLTKKDIIILLSFFSAIFNFIGHVINSNLIVYSSILLVIILMINSNIEYSTYILFITLPFFNLFTVTVGTTSMYYVFLFIYILQNIKININQNNSKWLIDRYMIFTIIVILTVQNIYTDISTSYLSWLIMSLVFLFLYKNRNINIFKIINYYTAAFIISSILGYIAINRNIMQVFPRNIKGVWNAGKTTLRFVGLTGESNGHAQIALILIAFNIIHYLICNSRKEKFKYAISIGMIVLFTNLTYSKMFILGLIAIIFLMIIYNFIKNIRIGFSLKKTLILMTLIPILVSIIGIYISRNIDNTIISNYIVRFSAKDLSTGRFTIYKYFLDILSSNILYMIFGIGFNKYNIPWGHGKHAHNIYLECILLTGIIGFLIVIILLMNKIRKDMKKNTNFILYIPLIVFLITGISLHSMLTNYFYFILMLIISITDDEYYINKINNR